MNISLCLISNPVMQIHDLERSQQLCVLRNWVLSIYHSYVPQSVTKVTNISGICVVLNINRVCQIPSLIRYVVFIYVQGISANKIWMQTASQMWKLYQGSFWKIPLPSSPKQSSSQYLKGFPLYLTKDAYRHRDSSQLKPTSVKMSSLETFFTEEGEATK